MAANVTIKVSMNTKLALAYIGLLRLTAPLLGAERTMRLARFMPRLVLLKVGNGPWRFFRSDPAS